MWLLWMGQGEGSGWRRLAAVARALQAGILGQRNYRSGGAAITRGNRTVIRFWGMPVV
jgi:hypothetical protein